MTDVHPETHEEALQRMYENAHEHTYELVRGRTWDQVRGYTPQTAPPAPRRVIVGRQLDHPRAPLKRGHPVMLWRLNPEGRWEYWEWHGGWVTAGAFTEPLGVYGDTIVEWDDTWLEPYAEDLT